MELTPWISEVYRQIDRLRTSVDNVKGVMDTCISTAPMSDRKAAQVKDFLEGRKRAFAIVVDELKELVQPLEWVSEDEKEGGTKP